MNANRGENHYNKWDGIVNYYYLSIQVSKNQQLYSGGMGACVLHGLQQLASSCYMRVEILATWR